MRAPETGDIIEITSADGTDVTAEILADNDGLLVISVEDGRVFVARSDRLRDYRIFEPAG